MNERQRQTGRQRHREKDREWVSERDVYVCWGGGGGADITVFSHVKPGL